MEGQQMEPHAQLASAIAQIFARELHRLLPEVLGSLRQDQTGAPAVSCSATFSMTQQGLGATIAIDAEIGEPPIFIPLVPTADGQLGIAQAPAPPAPPQPVAQPAAYPQTPFAVPGQAAPLLQTQGLGQPPLAPLPPVRKPNSGILPPRRPLADER